MHVITNFENKFWQLDMIIESTINPFIKLYHNFINYIISISTILTMTFSIKQFRNINKKVAFDFVLCI